jgi:spore germination protein YaaH
MRRLLLILAIVFPVNPGMSAARPQVYAWFPAQFGHWRTDGIEWNDLTHLCFRSVELRGDGTLGYPAGDPPASFVRTAHRHHVKVTVLVWVNTVQDSDGYLANHPQDAANHLLNYVRRNHLDGVNIDDERLTETNAISKSPNREGVNWFFRILHQTFKQANPEYHLSFAAPPVISQRDRYGTSWLDLRTITRYVDAVIPMGYTMNPPSIGWTTNPEPLGGGGEAAGTTTRDLKTLVGDYLNAMGGAKEKLLLGVSLDFGGYEWRCRTDTPLSPILGKGISRSLAECEEQTKLHGSRWDDLQKSPWYGYREGDAFVQGWYNDLRAWKAKLDWIREQQLGGIGVWALDGVNDPPQRWQALRHFISIPKKASRKGRKT